MAFTARFKSAVAELGASIAGQKIFLRIGCGLYNDQTNKRGLSFFRRVFAPFFRVYG